MLTINGVEYGLSYTIGASVAIGELYPQGAPKGAASGRFVIDAAVIMSNEYESRKKLEDPNYKKRPLTKELLLSLDGYYGSIINDAVNEAYTAGARRTVETEPPKKTDSKAKR